MCGLTMLLAMLVCHYMCTTMLELTNLIGVITSHSLVIGVVVPIILKYSDIGVDILPC